MRTQWFRGTVVGVIKDLVYASPAAPRTPQFFTVTSRGTAGHVIAIRTAREVGVAMPAIQGALERIWGPLPARRFRLLRDAWRDGLVPLSGPAILVALIAMCCIPLAAIGITGALLFSVRTRGRELAIRLALGADPSRLSKSVVRRALKLVSVGLAIGTAAGVLAGRAIGHQLFEVKPLDPWTITIVVVFIFGLAWLASLLPARLASRTDPARALKEA